MKSLKILLCVFICKSVFGQTGEFDMAEYQQFLSQHQNMSTHQLLDMYPAGQFNDTAQMNGESVCYLDSVEKKYDLTEYEKSLLRKHGFVVSERLRKNSFGWQFLDVWSKDLPVFISSDAILHAVHFKYDKMLAEVELGFLVDRLTQLLTKMHNKLPDLAEKYSTVIEMQQMLWDVDLYLTVPLKLLGKDISPYYSENESKIGQILQLIHAEDFDVYPFFSEHCKAIDFSQFKPRGHYVDNQLDNRTDPVLPKYFRAMMWLSRIEIYLIPPRSAPLLCPEQTPQDIQRQIIDAVLVNELMDLAESNSIYSEIEDVLTFFVGEQDNVTPGNIDLLAQSLHLTSASQLLDTLIVNEFQDSLKTKGFAFQRIQSQVLKHDPYSPESVRPASAFMLFGQRFIIDSYVTGEVVYDRIKYNGGFPCRLFPSTLDVLFALGNDAAAQLLTSELDQYHYSANINALRYLVDSYDSKFWNSSIYNMWLNSIRALNPPSNRNHLPPFMQTAAWWQQKMNTQLASWTELRHDNLLYAKPSYTGWVSCSYPCGYVEPFPELYNRLNVLAEKAISKFANLSFSNKDLKSSILDYFQILYGVSDTLRTVSYKELNMIPLNRNEISFMKNVLYKKGGYAGGDVNGWYIALMYGESIDYQLQHLTVSDYLVADYHTTPSDCAGNERGWILHAGTGPVDLAIITAKMADDQTVAFVGPVMSYYEHTTTNWQRLSDDEWVDSHLCGSSDGNVCLDAFKALSLAMRPDWVNLYMANTEGESRGTGTTLITEIIDDPGDVRIPATHIIAQNYPNPFNANTIIHFSIPYSMTYLLTELTIYNIQGKVINTLIKRELPFGNYLIRWDGIDDFGDKVGSGIYLYELRAGSNRYVGKMNLIK